MPCDTRLKKNQTIQQRKEEVSRAVGRIQARIIDGRVRVKVGPQGAIAFEGLTDGASKAVKGASSVPSSVAKSSWKAPVAASKAPVAEKQD